MLPSNKKVNLVFHLLYVDVCFSFLVWREWRKDLRCCTCWTHSKSLGLNPLTLPPLTLGSLWTSHFTSVPQLLLLNLFIIGWDCHCALTPALARVFGQTLLSLKGSNLWSSLLCTVKEPPKCNTGRNCWTRTAHMHTLSVFVVCDFFHIFLWYGDTHLHGILFLDVVDVI